MYIMVMAPRNKRHCLMQFSHTAIATISISWARNRVESRTKACKKCSWTAHCYPLFLDLTQGDCWQKWCWQCANVINSLTSLFPLSSLAPTIHDAMCRVSHHASEPSASTCHDDSRTVGWILSKHWQISTFAESIYMDFTDINLVYL